MVQFYERISINYIKKDVFQTVNVFTYQNYEFLYNNLSM